MSIRLSYLFGFIIISLLLLTSLYFQIFEGIMPCPLCTLQRITFGLLGLVFLVGIFLSSSHKGRLAINSLSIFFSILGIVFAGRQVWLQNFPSGSGTECGVSIQYMMQVLPMTEVLQKVFAGTAECTQRGWEFLHLNMAEWALIWFVAFLIMSICLFAEELHWKKNK
jgi:disulfide bond formation protein DsbB